MKKNNKKLNLVSIIFFMFLIIGCDFHPDIEITRKYVFNSDFGKKRDASFSIQKFIFKEENLTKIETLSGFEILNTKKVYDSTFFYVIASHDNHEIKKIFFNKKNKDIKWYINRNISKKTDTIGQLELDTWYLLGGLYKTWAYYVYVDKEGVVHNWAVNPVNI